MSACCGLSCLIVAAGSSHPLPLHPVLWMMTAVSVYALVCQSSQLVVGAFIGPESGQLASVLLEFL